MLRHAFTYMIAHGVPAILGFAAIVIFTRLLSTEEYGFYVVAMSLAGVFNAILFAWVRLSILRYQPEGDGADIRFTALVGYGLSAASAPIVLVICLLVTDSPLDQLLLATLVALALGMFEFGQEILKAQQQPSLYMRASILRAILTFVFSLTLVYFGFGGMGLLLGISGAYLSANLIFSAGIWRTPVSRFQYDIFRKMVVFGAPMAVSGMVYALHGALDRLIVVYFLGDEAAGVYGASADLVRQIVLFPGMAVGAAMIPLIIRSLSDGGLENANAQLELTLEMLLAALVPSAIGLALVAPAFSAVMLGPDFREMAVILIPILSLAWMFQALTHQYIHISFHLAKKSRLLVLQGVALLIVNIVATLALVPRFGLIGAALALVVAEMAGAVVGFVLANKAYPLPFALGRTLRVFAAGAFMAIPTYAVREMMGDTAVSLAVSILVGVVTYSIAAFVLDIVGVRQVLLNRLRS